VPYNLSLLLCVYQSKVMNTNQREPVPSARIYLGRTPSRKQLWLVRKAIHTAAIVSSTLSAVRFGRAELRLCLLVAESAARCAVQ
jgi:hypothetical protein